MKITRALFPIVAMMCVACSSTTKKVEQVEKTSNEMLTYENDFFTLDYPSTMVYEEDIEDNSGATPSVAKGIRVSLYDLSLDVPFVVSVQKSAFVDMFDTPEEGRDFSVALKQFDENEDVLETVDSLMRDSLTFGKYPAAMAGFLCTENGDTLLHKQLIVMANGELYYLNSTFDVHDDGTLQNIGDKILRSVKFKSGATGR